MEMLDRDLAFMRLVRASWEGRLGAEADLILAEAEPVERSLAAFTIANLCGLELAEGPGFGARLEAAFKEGGAGFPAGRVVSACATCGREACRDGRSGAACAAACPFNALMVDAEGGIHIDRELCADCGACVAACPGGFIQDKVEYLPATQLMKGGRPVIAAVAPAIASQFGPGASLERLRAAFKRLGYFDMVEVAFFADMLSLKEAGEFDAEVASKDDFLISSCCCPMWVAMLRKVYAGLVRHVSPSVSPMVAAGRALKALHPGCAVVFVGPCIAKKAEAKEAALAGAIDQVFTFQEMADVFKAAGIDPAGLDPEASSEYSSRGGRLYARAGGVSIAVAEAVAAIYPDKARFFVSRSASGVPACKELLAGLQTAAAAGVEGDAASKAMDGAGTAPSTSPRATFIEGMGCVGGCVGGPKAILPREEGRAAVDAFALGSAIPVATQSECMREVLARLGLFGPEDIMKSGAASIFERKFD
jgi:iron only hydrogenase large subunit-like protein